MNKKIICLGLFLVLFFCLTACAFDTGAQRYRLLEDKIAELEEENKKLADRIDLLESGLAEILKGHGRENSPYMIRTAQQLKAFAESVNNGEKYQGVYFALGIDIDLGGEEWTPIAPDNSNNFSGYFDGYGYKITNFKITAFSNLLGLFAKNNGVIKNLAVEDFNINVHMNDSSTSCFMGGLVGYNDGGALTNCYAEGTINISSNSNDTSYFYTGGLTGYTKGTVTDCFASVEINAQNTTGCIGGLTGVLYSGSVSSSYATGNVQINTTSNSSEIYAGGLTGGVHPAENTSITNCYATGNINVEFISNGTFIPTVYAGGLAGNNQNGTITACYAIGDVSASVTTLKTSSCYAYSGGLVGYNEYNGKITDCFAYGNLSASAAVSSEIVYPSTYAGGLVARNDYGAINNCYRNDEQLFYRKEVSPEFEVAAEYDTATEDAGTSRRPSRFNTFSLYADELGWSNKIWDFTDLNFATGKYPKLILPTL